MVYRMELTYDEIVVVLDVNYFAGSNIGYTLQPGIYESSDINLMLKSSTPNRVKVNITFVDIRLRSSSITNETIRFPGKSLLYTILGFTHSHSGVLGDID